MERQYFRGSVKIGDDLDMSSLNTDLIRRFACSQACTNLDGR